jgi:DNA helicase-2/ATP-dependent DNA helicase PcrA
LQSAEPSRFLQEIDKKYLQLPSRHEMPAFERSSFTERNSTARTHSPTRQPFQERTRTAATAAPAPPPGKRNLKKITSNGSPLEATSTLGEAAPEDIQEGVTVEHARFGKGKVVKVEGTAPDLKATIFFPAAGQKQLLLRFAKLRVVD